MNSKSFWRTLATEQATYIASLIYRKTNHNQEEERMAADELKRPLSVRFVAEGVTAEGIVKALFKQLPEEYIMCVCPTIAETWQITLLNEEAKERLVLTDLIVNNVRLEVLPQQDPPAFVSVKMPFEMADNVIISRIAENGQVAKITRHTYVFLCTTRGNRSESIQSTESRGYFPERIIYGKYNLCLHVQYMLDKLQHVIDAEAPLI